jgi:hypothetical protein
MNDKLTRYFRYCPCCGKELSYSFKEDRDKAEKKQTRCINCSDNKGRFKKGIRSFESFQNSSTNPNYNLSKLIDENIMSLYWLGFVLADGSVYDYKFELSIKKDDLIHLQKFASYIEFPLEKIRFRNSTNSNSILFSNRFSIPEFMNKWNIHYHKTYNPCDFAYFEHLTDNELFALLLGLIDGDGHIDKNTGKTISIAFHPSWENFYTRLLKRLNFPIHIYHRKSKSNKEICSLNIGDKESRIKIQEYIDKHSELPILNRKWSLIKI